MAWFRFVADPCPLLDEYLSEVNGRLSESDVVRSPFTGGVTSGVVGGRVRGLVEINPVYPSLDLFWYIGGVLVFVFGGFRVSVLMSVLLLLGLFFSCWRVGLFYFLVFWRGLRRKGYTGSFSLDLTFSKNRGLVFNGG